jgi:hypothetical protein
MEHYAGIDVSLELSSICIVDAKGKIVKETKGLAAADRASSSAAYGLAALEARPEPAVGAQRRRRSFRERKVRRALMARGSSG